MKEFLIGIFKLLFIKFSEHPLLRVALRWSEHSATNMDRSLQRWTNISSFKCGPSRYLNHGRLIEIMYMDQFTVTTEATKMQYCFYAQLRFSFDVITRAPTVPVMFAWKLALVCINLGVSTTVCTSILSGRAWKNVRPRGLPWIFVYVK